MASGKVKGITIAMEADTTGVTKGLKEVTAQSVALSKDLKSVNSLLKLDPGNATLLAEKQKILAENIETTKQKLIALRGAQEDVNKAYANGDINTEQYLAYQKELVQTEKRLSGLIDELEESDKALDNTGDEAKETAGDFESTTKSSGELGEALKGGLVTGAKAAVAALASATAAVGALALAVTKEAIGALVDLGKQTVMAFADYEQLAGGVETLFKDSASTVESYAENAYKTAGLSANEYMETVTGFSASLIQSLGGDTEKAAKYADLAITDMSDNANKMGSDMSSIQTAYQGFAKQNYTMLDNLKLGYGGTKEEMERLLQDATAISGVKYDINSYADVIAAIHEIQNSLDITGTTAKEADATISGSIASTKSAIDNLIAGLGQEGADIGGLVSNVSENLNNVLTNIEPVIENFIMALPELIKGISAHLPMILQSGSDILLAIIEGLSAALPDILPAAKKIISQFIDSITKVMPTILTAGAEILVTILEGIVDSLDELMPTIKIVIKTLIDGFVKILPQLLPVAVSLIETIATGLIDNIEPILNAALSIVLMLADALVEKLPVVLPKIVQIITELALMLTEPETLVKLIDAALQIILALGDGLIKAIPILLENLPTIIENVITALIEAAPMIIDAGVQLLSSLVSNMPEITARILAGITELINFLGEKFGEAWAAIQEVFAPMVEFFGNIWQGIKDIFFAVVDWFKERFESAWKAIKNAWKSVTQWFRNIWTAIKNVFSAVGTWFKEKFTAAWTAIKNAWSNATQWFSDIWTGISDTFKGVGTWFKEKFDAAYSSITGAFGGIDQFFKGIWTTISSPFSGAADSALQWGKDLIENFMGGIDEMWDDFVKKVTGVADVVKEFLGFSEPEKGPLSNFHTFAPDMIELFCEGLRKNTGKLEQAMTASLGTAMNGLENLASVEVSGAAAALPAQTVIDNSRTIYQTNNSPKSLSRLEIYRQTRNAVNMI